jgi:hypothetical protein
VLRGFLQNTAISAVAYAVAGVLGLFAVGVIARSYGVAVLGLIVLTRSFLPTGFFTLVDLGVSESTTQFVARGRVGDWTVANEKVSLLTVIATAIGVVSAILLWAAAAPLAAIFKVAPDQADAFIAILKVTAPLLPITFLGLVMEGALKGFEQYGWLRLTEVGGNALYVVAVYALIWQGAPFETIAYAYLAMTVAKYLVLAIVLYRAARATPLRFCPWTASSRRDVVHRCWLMFHNRIAGFFAASLGSSGDRRALRPCGGGYVRSDHPAAAIPEGDDGATPFRNPPPFNPYRRELGHAPPADTRQERPCSADGHCCSHPCRRRFVLGTDIDGVGGTAACGSMALAGAVDVHSGHHGDARGGTNSVDGEV